MNIATYLMGDSNTSPRFQKEPWVAVLFSSINPGLGQIYGPSKIKGVIIFLILNFGLYIALRSILSCDGDTIMGYGILIAVLFLYILNLFDAFFVVKKFNSTEFEEFRQKCKDPYLAIFLTSLLPGLGHVYARKMVIGFTVIFFYFACLFLKDYLQPPIQYFFKMGIDLATGIIAYNAYQVARSRRIYFTRTRFLIGLLVPFQLILPKNS